MMKVDEWAIGRLNELDREALQASQQLRHTISLHELEAQDDTSTFELPTPVIYD